MNGVLGTLVEHEQEIHQIIKNRIAETENLGIVTHGNPRHLGPSELIFIVILALIVLGPKDMQKAGLTIGKFLRKIITSEGWEVFQKLSHQVRTWPNRMMREANEDLNMIGNELKQRRLRSAGKTAQSL